MMMVVVVVLPLVMGVALSVMVVVVVPSLVTGVVLSVMVWDGLVVMEVAGGMNIVVKGFVVIVELGAASSVWENVVYSFYSINCHIPATAVIVDDCSSIRTVEKSSK